MTLRFPSFLVATAVSLGMLSVGPVAVVAAVDAGPDPAPAPQVSAAVAHDTSAPLRKTAAAVRRGEITASATRDFEVYKPTPGIRLDALLAATPEPVVIPDPTGPAPGAQMPAVASGFEGIGQHDQTDPNQQYYPPDPDGDVGPNHYVEMVNAMTAVYDKSGNALLGPMNSNLIWLGFNDGNCATNNDGDPIVQYDQFADRWLLTQFSVSGPGYYECVAVSATPDPTGAYHRYAFQYSDFPDYPKFGVWPDGYYVTYNMFDGNNFDFLGVKVCALERSAMLAGDAASQQCFDEAQEWSLLPSDANGTTPPPAGSPNYLLGESWDDNELLTMYKFHVDWANPAASSWAGPISIRVNAFTWACVRPELSGRCIPQPDTAVKLDSLGARAMYRLAYRNFGTHESLVVNHTVPMQATTGQPDQTGIGWYELRDLQRVQPTVHQQGTSADPDATTYRWMGSIATDKQGNMALGYSKSSSTVYPSIATVGRLVDDPLNTMPQAETTIMAGTGSQTGASARWGDYSSMQVDPVDDCTFWYVNEYLQTTSTKDWRTRVASFKYPSCTGTASVPGAPAAAAATPASGTLDVSWQPGDNGGMPIVGYTVVASPGGATCSTRVGVDPDPLRCTLTGLTNGTDYTVSVTARNGLGEGAATTANAVPFTKPAAPTAVTGSPGNGQVLVSWQQPADGGRAVASYVVRTSPGAASCTTPQSVPAPTSCTVTGLSNGTPYTFTVTAANDAGSGPESQPSAAVTPFTVPSAPRSVAATRGDAAAAVVWQEPATTGGSPITSYTATASPGGASCQAAGSAPGCVIAGLTNGTTYRVSVVAANAAGSGPASGASTQFTPIPDRSLAVSATSPVRPRSKIRVAIAGAGTSCRVKVTVGKSWVTTPVDTAGTAVVRLTAPKPNGRYNVTARQEAASPTCIDQTATTATEVRGPYITGSKRPRVEKRLAYKGKEFRPNRTVAWKVKSGGKRIAAQKVATARSGVSTFRVKFPREGAYRLVAEQGKRKAAYNVSVR